MANLPLLAFSLLVFPAVPGCVKRDIHAVIRPCTPFLVENPVENVDKPFPKALFRGGKRFLCLVFNNNAEVFNKTRRLFCPVKWTFSRKPGGFSAGFLLFKQGKITGAFFHFSPFPQIPHIPFPGKSSSVILGFGGFSRLSFSTSRLLFGRFLCILF